MRREIEGAVSRQEKIMAEIAEWTRQRAAVDDVLMVMRRRKRRLIDGMHQEIYEMKVCPETGERMALCQFSRLSAMKGGLAVVDQLCAEMRPIQTEAALIEAAIKELMIELKNVQKRIVEPNLDAARQPA